MSLGDRQYEGGYLDNYPTLGTYTDERGALFTVEMKDETHFSQVKVLGDGAFKSKVPLQVAKTRGPVPGRVAFG